MCWAWLYVHSLSELSQGFSILTSEMRNRRYATGPNFTASKELIVKSRPLKFSTQNPVAGNHLPYGSPVFYLFMVVPQTENMAPDEVQLAQSVVVFDPFSDV